EILTGVPSLAIRSLAPALWTARLPGGTHPRPATHPRQGRLAPSPLPPRPARPRARRASAPHSARDLARAPRRRHPAPRPPAPRSASSARPARSAELDAVGTTGELAWPACRLRSGGGITRAGSAARVRGSASATVGAVAAAVAPGTPGEPL